MRKKQQALKQQTQQSTAVNNPVAGQTNIGTPLTVQPKVLSLNTDVTNILKGTSIGNQLPSPTNVPNLIASTLNPNGQQFGQSDLTGNGQTIAGASGSASSNSQRERAALLHAHQNSFGFFISQDSSFGNQILPVIPLL